MSKRVLILGMVLVFGLLCILSQSGYAKKMKISYWALWGGYEEGVMRAAVEKFNNSQPDLEVEYLRIPDIGTKLLASITAGNPPDMAFLWSYSVSSYAHRKGIMSLEDFMKDSSLSEDMFVPVLWDLMFYEGKLYALPSLPWSIGFYYNKDIFREVGLDPEVTPKTMAELDELSDKITERDESGRVTQMGFVPWSPGWWEWAWPYYFGGDIYDEANQKVTITTPEAIAAYKWEASYAEEYGVSQMQTFTSGFGSYFSQNYPFFVGKTAMELAGTWEGKYIRNNAPDMDWGVAPPPVQAPGVYGSTYVYADVHVIPRGAKHPKEAFQFMEFLYNKDVMADVCEGFFTFSSIRVNNEDTEWIEGHDNPKLQTSIDLAFDPNAFHEPACPITDYLWSELIAAKDEIVWGKSTAEEALAKAEGKIQAELDKAFRK